MIRSVVELTPQKGAAERIVRHFAARKVLESAVATDGCISCELAVPADGNGPIVVSCLWRDEQAYADWVARPGRGEPSDLTPHIVVGDGGVPAGRAYAIKISV